MNDKEIILTFEPNKEKRLKLVINELELNSIRYKLFENQDFMQLYINVSCFNNRDISNLFNRLEKLAYY